MLFASGVFAAQTKVLVTVTQLSHVPVLILQQVRHHWSLTLLLLACKPDVFE